MNSRHVKLTKRLGLGVGFALVAGISLLSCQNSTDPSKPPSPAEVKGGPYFQDMTAQSGVDFTYRNGESEPHYGDRSIDGKSPHYAILESLGGGVGLIDYDGDGLLDIFLAGGGYYDGPDLKQIKGHPNRLYKNLGGWKFKDVTKEVGLDQPLFYSHGCAVGDYDRDGWPDLVVTGYGRLALYHNESDGKGGRKFVEVTKQAGLLGEHFWSTSAGFADFDGDGRVDLYVCQYVNWSWENNPICAGYNTQTKQDVCPPKQYQSRRHALYRNNGDGTFTDATKEAGIRVTHPDGDLGKGLGVVIVDLNMDGKPDIYVANDTTDNFLYLNRSEPGRLRFDDVGLEMGVARDNQGIPNGSMGVDAGDPFGTGLPSLWVANYEGELHALYRNNFKDGRLSFSYATNTSGIAAIGQMFVGFGTGFLDIDNDGWEDIFVSNGHVVRHPHPATLAQRPVLFYNLGKGKFRDISKQEGSYFQAHHRGRGLAIGDLDNDGFPDVVTSQNHEPVALLRNVRATKHHWLGVELIGKDRHNVVGAKATLEVDGKKLTRFAKGGGSYLSANDQRLLFGLGETAQSGSLTIDWGTGQPRIERWENLASNRYHKLVQGSGRAP